MTDPSETPKCPLSELVAWCHRKPNQKYAYNECRYCGQTWWDHPLHRGDCIVTSARERLQALAAARRPLPAQPTVAAALERVAELAVRSGDSLDVSAVAVVRNALENPAAPSRVSLQGGVMGKRRNPRSLRRKWPIPVEAAREIAERYGYTQVIIYARLVGDDGGEHMTTWGQEAARIGAFLQQKIMGWKPEHTTTHEDRFARPTVTTAQVEEAVQAALASGYTSRSITELQEQVARAAVLHILKAAGVEATPDAGEREEGR